MIVGGRGPAEWSRMPRAEGRSEGQTKRGVAPIDEAMFRTVQRARMSLPERNEGPHVDDLPRLGIRCIDGDVAVARERCQIGPPMGEPIEPAFLDAWRLCFVRVEPALIAAGMPVEIAARPRRAREVREARVIDRRDAREPGAA